MTSERRVLWPAIGIAVGVVALVAVVGAALSAYGETFWRAIGAIVILLAAGSSMLAAAELIRRRRLGLFAWWVLLTAPIDAATLLVANWKDHVSELYARGLVTATVLLLAGLIVVTMRLFVRLELPIGWAAFSAEVLFTAVLVVLALVLTWAGSTPDGAVRVLLGLIAVVLVLYAGAPIAQSLASRSGRPRRL
jgi:hypothetical protein